MRACVIVEVLVVVALALATLSSLYCSSAALVQVDIDKKKLSNNKSTVRT